MSGDIIFEELEKKAEAGDAESQYLVGCGYYYGEYGKKVDKNEAWEWFQKSANQGYPEAQYNAGRMLYFREFKKENFKGTEKDLKKAVASWIKLAINNDSKNAEFFWKKYKLWEYE